MRKYTYLLSLFALLALTIFFAENARAVFDPNAKHSKWYVDRLMADPLRKSTVEIKAQRNYPVSTLGADGKPIIQQKVQKSVIKLAPKAANVGKSLIKRAPAIAITQAVVALLGKGVDWVMDAENNRIKYKDSSISDPTHPSNRIYYRAYLSAPSGTIEAFSSSSNQDAANKVCSLAGGNSVSAITGNQGSFFCSGNSVNLSGGYALIFNPEYDPSASAPANDWQYIPIDQVAQKIIDQAAAGEPAAMEVMSNSALDQLEAGLLNDQLEAAAESKIFNEGESDPTDPNAPNPDPDAPTDPNAPNPDAKPFELPPFCSWAVKVCDFIDWVQTEPSEPEESGDIEVQKPDPVIHEDLLERLYINMPAQCPPDPVLEFMGARIPFPMSVFCQFAVMMKPLILLFAYIKGLAIIGNGLS